MGEGVNCFQQIFVHVLRISGWIMLKCIDVPRPLINDLWVFLFEKIDAECVK